MKKRPVYAPVAAGLRAALERHYRRFNRRRYVHPDPLERLYDYPDPDDQEVVGLLAAGLAYGNVRQILRSLDDVLSRLGGRPARFVRDATPVRLTRAMAGFRHRWTTGAEVAALLAAVRRTRIRCGSLEKCFRRAITAGDETVVPALGAMFEQLCPSGRNSLLSDPRRGSASKRLHLYLRWMVRRDAVDVGPWRRVPSRLLVVPLDTHMLHIARALGLTERRSADARTALAVTAAFRAFRPDDPVRYDFSLTRLGIHPDVRPCEFLAEL
ncbi:MAG: TIGR02757 family protein [Planctomycetes bacterium]|nr:TIGR02757 family protein [Planctomycetota bacterium]